MTEPRRHGWLAAGNRPSGRRSQGPPGAWRGRMLYGLGVVRTVSQWCRGGLLAPWSVWLACAIGAATTAPEAAADEGRATRSGVAPAGSWTCVPEGRECTFGSDCCSDKCVNDPKLGKVCKPKDGSWTCVPQGRECTFGSDCCSKKCVSDPKLGKVCKPSLVARRRFRLVL